MAKLPKVSILCLTYNQEKYVSQALDSFLMQETDFDFEVLINDDASTDGTVKILKEYAKLYPDIIKPIFHKENLYSQGFRNLIGRFLFPKAKGKYIAICEGDDYWTDPAKLQIQVDFLDKNPEYSVCFHTTRVVYENNTDKEFVFPDVKHESWYTAEELLRTNYIPTNTVMYRKQRYQKMPTNLSPVDWYLHLYHAKFGKIKFLDQVMSVYRKHSAGIWWDYDKDRDALWRKNGPAHIAMQDELLKLYESDPRAREIISLNIDRLVDNFIEIDKKYGDNLVRKVMTQFPDHVERCLLHNHQMLIDKSKELKKMAAEVDKLWQAVRDQDAIIAAKNAEINALKTSLTWRLLSKAAKLKGRKRPG